MRQLQKYVRLTLLCGCLCLLAFHLFGVAPATLVRWPGTTQHSVSFAFSAGEDASATATLVCARDGLSRDAELTDRRQLSLVSDAGPRARSAGIQPPRFHNNSRPVVLRTRAVFCDASLLRSILHPQFDLIAHASSVLC